MRLGGALSLRVPVAFDMQKVLVTGANGFIGRELCQLLVAQAYEVRALVRDVRSTLPGVEYVEADLEHPQNLAAICQGIDCIVHLAGRAHILSGRVQNPLELFRQSNCEATLRLARQAVEAGVRRFVFISSIGVNGAQTFGEPFDELSTPAPHADYAVSKLEAEEGLKKLFAGTGIALVIIRPPLVYGADAPGNFARLLKLVASGLPLPLRALNNRRSLVSLENLVEFVRVCISSPSAADQLFLVSDGSDVSTSEMVLALARGMGKRPLMVPFPDGLLRWGAEILGKESLYKQLYGSLQVNSSKALSMLDWQPKENTQDALERVGRLYLSRHLNHQ